MIFSAFALLFSVFVSIGSGLSVTTVKNELGPKLSKSASISGNASAYARWSEYDAPSPAVIVNVATEHDVVVTAQYCLHKHIPFLAQTGAHGWATTFKLNHDGILINMRGLDSVIFNQNKTQATIGGGTVIGDVMTAASANGALVQTGNCNCVGTLGAILGGGYGNLLGLYGFGVDNVLSLNVVMADGVLRTITPADHELFWALRGAGPNFGIVTSATVKSYPVAPSGQNAWLGELIYTADKVEAVVRAIDQLTLKPEMNAFLYFMTTGAPAYEPIVVVTPFYYGTEADGRAAFASLLDINPTNDTTTEQHYVNWNTGSDGFCTKGGYKPSYTVALGRLVASTWKAVWDEYVTWVSKNGTGNSIIIMEGYSLDKARLIPDNSSSFPWRNSVNFNAVAIPWYYDESLQSAAVALGEKMRDMWRATDSLSVPASYINFAHGDEDLSVIYGDNLDRLRKIKAEADPANVFDQWFNL